MEAQGPKTVTVEEAARLCGIGRALAYQLARENRLPGVIRLGRRLVVSRAALEALLEGRGAAQGSGADRARS